MIIIPVIFILLIVLYILYIVVKKRGNIEIEIEGFTNDFQDLRFQSYNQNYDKEWKAQPQAYNYPVVPEYPTSYNDLYEANKYIFTNIDNETLKIMAKKISFGFDMDLGRDALKRLLGEYKKNKTFDKFVLKEINSFTWFNRWKNYNPNKTFYLPYIESKIGEVNYLNNYFLSRFNKLFFKYINVYYKRKVIFYKPYFIYKYRIVNVYENKSSMIYQLMVVIVRDGGYLAYEFEITGVFNKVRVVGNSNGNSNGNRNSNGKGSMSGLDYGLSKMYVDYIGNYSLDQLLLPKNINNFNSQYENLNPLYRNFSSIYTPEKINTEKELYGKGKRVLRNTEFDNSYVCFGYNSNDKIPSSMPIFAVNKTDCESNHDIIGSKKPYGVWDTPCKSDNECVYYKANQNYDNDYGKCVLGKCTYPLNMRNLGYHYFIDHPKTKPLCYNCGVGGGKNREWMPKTKLGFCCEEQKDRKKYPFLKGPDYAFLNDGQKRYNEYIKKNCKVYSIYNKIFDNKPDKYEVRCKNNVNFFIPM